MNVRLPRNEDINIANGKDIARIMRKILLRQNRLHRKKEYFWSIGLNTNNDIEYIELLAIGSFQLRSS
jgi:DNA repair protein RadC